MTLLLDQGQWQDFAHIGALFINQGKQPEDCSHYLGNDKGFIQTIAKPQVAISALAFTAMAVHIHNLISKLVNHFGQSSKSQLTND